MARNRVAPLKSITLPRLELMGAVVGVRLAKHLVDNIGEMKINFWCDSQIVLKWISSTKPLKKFIANRITEIKQLITPHTWRYCPTDMNPADLLTRGVSATVYSASDLWKQGPNWITRENDWPIWDGNLVSSMHTLIEEEHLEQQIMNSESELLACVLEVQETSLLKIFNLDRFSSLRKLLRVTSFVQRFITNCKSNRDQRKTHSLTVDEIQLATRKWILSVQQSEFQDETKCIVSTNRKSSIVRQLRLFQDEYGLLRCGGRLNNACISELAKYPYLLPTSHKFTRLIVMDAHVSQLHGGVNSTVTQLRQCYWIPRIRQCVKTVLRKCVTCRKVTGHAYPQPNSPPLPIDRVQDTTPFTVTGTDFAGPLYLKNSETTKVYICLFTCASTRAIHLEIVPNLSEDSFMLAFRRFSSRKSLPRVMMSDNATTFISAAKEIQQLTNSTTIKEKLSQYGTIWKFIPRSAPWYGGYWERLIGLTKTCLRKVLGRACVHMEQLQTVITEIEAYINDRPITYVSSELDEPEPLTPSHLLYGRRITCLPYPYTGTINTENEICEPITNKSLNIRLQSHCELIQHFRNRWKSEYLTSLREYHKVNHGRNIQTICIGDVVQIHDNNTPRNTWKLAVVDELLHGSDKLVRAAKLRTSNGFTNRPIKKLYPIEVSDDPLLKDTGSSFRRSKEEAKLKIRDWTK